MRRRPQPDRGSRLLKVCGVTSAAEIDSLAVAGADCVGLWHGVPGGHAELTERQLAELAGAARETGGLEPVLVTLSKDTAALTALAERTGIRWIQLHAFQPPSTVRALRAALPDVVIVKAVHLRGDDCPERPLIGSYRRAGTDVFLLDTMTGDGRIGSTGERLPDRRALALAAQLTAPFLLAGGITAAAHAEYPLTAAHSGFLGIDVDHAARGSRGRVSTTEVSGLVRAWRTGPAPGPGAEIRRNQEDTGATTIHRGAAELGQTGDRRGQGPQRAPHRPDGRAFPPAGRRDL